MTDRPVAIIPARGGSKRLPRKNLLEVAGRPMLAWPIAAAHASDLFEAIVVSTEDAEIAGLARSQGARSLARPAALATDAATVAEVCRHVLDVLRGEGTEPSCFCCLLPTAAFVTASDLVGSLALLDAPPPADVVLGVSPYTVHPYKALRAHGPYLASAAPEHVLRKSQDYPDLVASNGTLIWARAALFLARPGFYVERLKGYAMDPLRGQDLDTAEDLERVRRLAPLFRS